MSTLLTAVTVHVVSIINLWFFFVLAQLVTFLIDFVILGVHAALSATNPRSAIREPGFWMVVDFARQFSDGWLFALLAGAALNAYFGSTPGWPLKVAILLVAWNPAAPYVQGFLAGIGEGDSWKEISNSAVLLAFVFGFSLLTWAGFPSHLWIAVVALVVAHVTLAIIGSVIAVVEI